MGIFGAIAAIDAVGGATAAAGAADNHPPKGLDPLSATLARAAVADMPQIHGAGDVLSLPGTGKSKAIEIT